MIYESLKVTRAARKAARRAYLNMTHRGRTGHNWKAAESGDVCARCNKVRRCARMF